MSIEQRFNELLQALYDEKQGRTERDRYVAIAITDVEKAKAVWITYAGPNAIPLVNWNK